MKSSLNKIFGLAFAVIMFVGAFVTPISVSAQPQSDFNNGIGICDFIGPICEAIGLDDNSDDVGETAFGFLRTRMNLILSVVFVGIILIAVFVIVRAGVTYIQSQGNEAKIGEAQKAIKNVFIGIAVLFVGIIGIILVLAFFGGTGLIDTDNTTGCRLTEAGFVDCQGQ